MISVSKNNETWIPESVFIMLTFDLISRWCHGSRTKRIEWTMDGKTLEETWDGMKSERETETENKLETHIEKFVATSTDSSSTSSLMNIHHIEVDNSKKSSVKLLKSFFLLIARFFTLRMSYKDRSFSICAHHNIFFNTLFIQHHHIQLKPFT